MNRKDRLLVVGKNSKIQYKDGDNGMLLLTGTPGCGKSFYVVTPNIINNSGESFIVDDKKGSLYKLTGDILRGQGYKVEVLDLKTFSGDFKYNIFDGITSRSDIRRIANFLIPTNNSNADPFWRESAVILLRAVIEIALIEEKELTIEKLFRYLYKISTKEDKRTGTLLDSDFDRLVEAQKLRGVKTLAHNNYEMCRDCATDTWKSIVISLKNGLGYLEDENIYKMTNKTSMDIKSFGEEKTALFVISSDTDMSLDPLIKLIYSQIMDNLLSYADTKDNCMLTNHVRFILDDFASGCIMNGFENVIANARSRNVVFTLCIQSVAQLEALYDKQAKSIMDCINYKVYFPSANFETQRHIAELLNKPVEEVQKMPANKLCLERIYDKPQIIDRFENPEAFVEKAQSCRINSYR